GSGPTRIASPSPRSSGLLIRPRLSWILSSQHRITSRRSVLTPPPKQRHCQAPCAGAVYSPLDSRRELLRSRRSRGSLGPRAPGASPLSAMPPRSRGTSAPTSNCPAQLSAVPCSLRRQSESFHQPAGHLKIYRLGAPCTATHTTS